MNCEKFYQLFRQIKSLVFDSLLLVDMRKLLFTAVTTFRQKTRGAKIHLARESNPSVQIKSLKNVEWVAVSKHLRVLQLTVI